MPPASPRRMPQQERAQATVEAVLGATVQILLKDGWDALSTNRIAREAGVSVGSLYQYFPNKQAIVRELLVRYSEEQFQMLVEGLMSLRAGMPLEEAVRSIIRALLSSQLNAPSLMRACFEQLPAGEQVDALRDWSRRAIPLIELALASRHHEIGLDPGHLNLAAFMLLHSIDGVMHAGALLAPDTLLHPRFEDECVRLVMGYLRPTPDADRDD
jgi:AcrR family transcriptional regulator